MRPPEILQTTRLRLRPPILEDADSVFTQYAQDPEVTRYLTWRPHKEIEDTRNFLKRCQAVWEDGSAFVWAITRREDNQLLGMIEININASRVMVGYVLARVYWGNGYMPEAVQAIANWALGQEIIYRVWAFCDVDNRASARVLEKVGMQREGLLRRWSIHPNLSSEPRDCHCYGKVK